MSFLGGPTLKKIIIGWFLFREGGLRIGEIQKEERVWKCPKLHYIICEWSFISFCTTGIIFISFALVLWQKTQMGTHT